jgi:hypothetical protein
MGLSTGVVESLAGMASAIPSPRPHTKSLRAPARNEGLHRVTAEAAITNPTH